MDGSHSQQLMVLEHRHRRGGTEGERRRDGKVEGWSAVVPLDQTMMGLYYPAMLTVSSVLYAQDKKQEKNITHY